MKDDNEEEALRLNADLTTYKENMQENIQYKLQIERVGWSKSIEINLEVYQGVGRRVSRIKKRYSRQNYAERTKRFVNTSDTVSKPGNTKHGIRTAASDQR